MRQFHRAARFFAAGLLAHASQFAWATDYYVNPNAWFTNDTNAGTSESWPWKTLDKVNSATLKDGDRVLFRKGQKWEGTLKLKNGVTYGSYPSSSSEDAPVIRASSYIGGLSWSKYSGNIYVADVSSRLVSGSDVMGVNYPAAITQLTYNGARLQRARYPNVGGGVFKFGANRFLKIANGTPAVELDLASTPSATQSMLLDSGALPSTVTSGDLIGAQVYAKNFAWYLTRYTVSTASSATNISLAPDMTWPGAKGYPLYSGNGYWLENKLWMLDQAGEWVFDPAAKKLYVWLPGNASPVNANLNASSRIHGIEGRDVSKVSISGITVIESRGDGIAISRPTASVTLSGVTVLRAGGMGISVTNNGSGTGSISGSLVADSAAAGIYLGSNSTRNINVTNNTVQRAGRGFYAHAGIWLGHGSTASGNVVDGSSYIGIRAAKSNNIKGNQILNSCTEFDDCGGIYARGLDYDGTPYGLTYKNDVNNVISNNFVDGTTLANAKDRVDGLANIPADIKTSGTNGVYLDDFSGRVTVDGNYVTGFDHGVMIHYGRYNIISNNKLVGNARAQLWMQENAHGGLTDFVAAGYCGSMPDCDSKNYLRFNTVQGNLMASRETNPVIIHSSDFAGADDFGTYSNNIYATYGSPTLVRIEAGGVTNLTYGQWTARGQDMVKLSPWNVFATAPGVKAQTGASNMITNGGFDQGLTAWSYWNAVTSATGSGCLDAVACLLTEPSASASTESSGRKVSIVNTDSPLTITNGQTYLMSFSAKADLAGEYVYSVLRDMSNYTDKSNYASTAMTTAWQNYTVQLKANSTLSNARLDFQFSTLGKVRVDNVRLLPATVVSGDAQPVGFYNAGSTAKSFACPNANSNSCTLYVDAQTGAAVSFPLSVAAGTSRILVLKNPTWMDADRDGVPGDGATGGLDQCSSTLDGAGVNELGCAAGQ